jgi:predicted phage terminase large subunit-like protein
LDVWRDRVSYDKLKRIVLEQYERWEPDQIAVERAASGWAIVQEFSAETRLPIVGVPSTESKVSRAQSVVPLFAANRVMLPDDRAPFIFAWCSEHLRFSEGARADDQVDTTSLALTLLKKMAPKPLHVALGGTGVVHTIAGDGTSSRSTEVAPLPSLPETDPSVLVLPAAKSGTAAAREREETLAAEEERNKRLRAWEQPRRIVESSAPCESAPLTPMPHFRTAGEADAWRRERELTQNAETESAAARIHGRRR